MECIPHLQMLLRVFHVKKVNITIGEPDASHLVRPDTSCYSLNHRFTYSRCDFPYSTCNVLLRRPRGGIELDHKTIT